ncbi:MAG: hypothetical protein ACHQK8_02850 [Bacteroidia bacterium]
MRNFIKYFASATLLVILVSFDNPKGWFIAGDKPGNYELSLALKEGINNGNCATIKSVAKKINGYGTIIQSSSPEEFFGKRIKMTGFIKTKLVDNWAGLFLRADVGSITASLDNMEERPIKGTTDWKKYEIVIDIPANATQIAYGAILFGTGQVWLDNISFEVVDKKTPVTSSIFPEPLNLNFEH